jgi:beta-mannosidase
MDHHNKDNPKNKGDNLMEATTGVPHDLDEYIDFSMMAQAEGLKFGIEHYRRRFPHCAGSLVWQLNDCWPVLSWSVLDYYGFGKAGYFYLKRVNATQLASFKVLPDGGVELWLTNNRLDPFVDTVTVQLGTFDGSTIWEQRVDLSIPANTSLAVRSWSAGEIQGSPATYIAVRSDADLFPQNRTFFSALKDLDRQAGIVEVTTSVVDSSTLEVHLAARNYAHFVHLIVPIDNTTFSDNYFDLLPGEKRVVTVSNTTHTLDPHLLTARWR